MGGHGRHCKVLTHRHVGKIHARPTVTQGRGGRVVKHGKLKTIMTAILVRGVMMSFLGDGMPLASVRGKEIFGTGISIKEEFSEYVTEDSCLEIKEEPLDYGDEARNEVCNVNVIHESHFFHNLHDVSHDAHAKDSCNLVQYCNVKERLKEDTQLKVESTKKCFACEVCGKELSQKRHVSIHMRVHTREKPYNCETCYKTFPSKGDLEKHGDIHIKEKPYNCEICSKTFSYKSSFLKHMIMHTEEKPYSCELCNKAFSRKHNLVKHTRVHTKKKSYSCETCNRAFSDRGHLITHIRVHTKEKPYKCEICENAF
ncbi:zinc finger protein 32-like [Penaeus monodon]|uniref:zinc finger protein 32-like n=1 Tax=Penaeus monodon TaxID=6687 RepID=UPI0018A78958|nr:zinc finger protein 32-like [Penaeus monodon]